MWQAGEAKYILCKTLELRYTAICFLYFPKMDGQYSLSLFTREKPAVILPQLHVRNALRCVYACLDVTQPTGINRSLEVHTNGVCFIVLRSNKQHQY